MAVVNPVPKEKAAAEVEDIFAGLIKKFGHMPNFFGMMAHRPAVLKSFMPLYAAITGEGTVEAKYKELAYLKTSMINGCQYCTRAHTASGKKAGVTEEQIKDLVFYSRSSAFDAKEKATILYADRVTRGAAGIREGTLEELKKYYNAEQIVELTLVICIANFTNRLNDSLEVVPDLG